MKRTHNGRFYLKYTVAVFMAGIVLTGMFPQAVPAGTTFWDTMTGLTGLEQLAESYAEETAGADARALASCYLFSDRYSGGLWEKVGIVKDEGFEDYVKERDGSLASLKEIETLPVPAGYEVDFLHMAASLYVGDDAGGWIGDLTEFAWELKNNGITDRNMAAERFLSADSYWNEADFHADVDAANMRKAYKGQTLSGTLISYYGNEVASEEESLGQFAADHFSAGTQEEFEKAVFGAYKTHWLMSELLRAFDLDASEDEAYLKLASDTMADYLWTHAKMPQTETTDTGNDGGHKVREEQTEDTEFPYWEDDTDGAVVRNIPDVRSGGGLAVAALVFLIAVFLFVAYNRKK